MHLSALCGASSAYLFIPRALDARRRGARTASARTRPERSEIASESGGAAPHSPTPRPRRVARRARVATRTARAMALTTSVARARDARASADRVVGLVGGLRVVVDALREHAADGLATNVAHVREDAMYVVFLAASVIGFGTVASGEMMSLRRRRDRARAALKECATMLDLKSKETSGATATTAGRKTRDAGVGKRTREIGVGKDFWNELGYLLKVAFPTAGSRGGQLLGAQFTLLVMRTLLTVRANKVNTFYLTKAISSASWKFWVRWFFNFGGWMASGVVVNSGLRYTESLITIELRAALTKKAHKMYMENNNFYKTAVLRQGALDNVDQRIVADIDAFAKETAFLYGHSFKPILEFTLSLTEAAKELGYSRPLALFASQIIITGVLRSIAPRLGPMIAREAALEGGFRHTHARLIAHAEEIALLDGGKREIEILDEGLDNLVVTQRWHALQRIRKSVADNVSKFQGLLVGSIFVHVPFMMKASVSEGERISSFRATEELMLRCGGAFTEVLLLGKNLDELAGYTHRLSQLFKTLDLASKEARKDNAKLTASGAVHTDHSPIMFDKVTVGAPEPDGSQRVLVKDLTLAVASGQHLLITGPNGCGKTSLLRVLAGLWAPVSGTVTRPSGVSSIMWLPQRPYLLQGSLRDQVVYPRDARTEKIDDARVKECLMMAGLAKFVDGSMNVGLNTRHLEWNDVLSGGERQRIGFARLYYHAPKFAILDEATSAINPDEESKLYERLIETDTTVVSIAHRLELRKFHKLELKIAGDGEGGFRILKL